MKNTLLHTTALALVLAGTSLWAQEATTPETDDTTMQTEEAAPADDGATMEAEEGTDSAAGAAATDESAEEDMATEEEPAEDDGAMAEEGTDDGMSEEAGDEGSMAAEGTDDGAMATEESGDMAAEDATDDAAETESAATGSDDAVIPQQESADIRGDWLLNTTVTSPDGETIGDIQDFIITDDGKVKAVVLSVGGFLGIGSKDIAVDYSKLDIQYDGDQIVLAMTREQAEAAEEYKYRDPETPPPATGDMGGTAGTGTGTMGGTAATGTGAAGTAGTAAGTETND